MSDLKVLPVVDVYPEGFDKEKQKLTGSSFEIFKDHIERRWIVADVEAVEIFEKKKEEGYKTEFGFALGLSSDSKRDLFEILLLSQCAQLKDDDAVVFPDYDGQLQKLRYFDFKNLALQYWEYFQSLRKDSKK